MNTTTTAALPADVEMLMRGLRLPHARAIAADVLATAARYAGTLPRSSKHF
jgi:hypothetical protein